MLFQPIDNKVLRWCLRLGVVTSLLLSSSNAMAEQRNCLRIDPVRKQQASPKEKKIAQDKLVEVLQDCSCPEGDMETVELTGYNEDAKGSSSSEGEDKKDVNQETKRRLAKDTPRALNLSRHSRRKVKPKYDVNAHYVKVGEKMPTPLSLANDAKKIHEAQHSSQSRGGTTILCVALRDYNGHVRRFVFRNYPGSMPLSFFQQASNLGYDESSAVHAHAEVQFLDFLYKRNQNRQRYTHIVGMGCSRPHCKECDCVLQLMLGTNYQTITAAAIEKERSREVTGMNAPLDEDNPHVTLTKQEKVEYDLVTKNEAVSDTSYQNYAIPDALKEKIAQQAGIQVRSWGEGYASKTDGQGSSTPEANPSRKRKVA